jgi:glycerophosphoryl diester phosphodiesterase
MSAPRLLSPALLLAFLFLLPVSSSAQDAQAGPTPIIVQSHRGAGVLAPENTIAAFELGWKLGTIPEADVRTTQDGVIVAFHDADFSRVVHDAPPELKKKGVKDVTFRELAALEVGAEGQKGFERRHVSSLEEVFALMRGTPGRRLYLDIKQVELPKLAALVRSSGVESQVILASTKLEIVRSWRALLPGSHTLLWMGGTEESLRERIEGLRQSGFAGVTQLQVHINQVKDSAGVVTIQPSEAFLREIAAELKPRRILFQALPWAGSDPEIYRRLLALGVESFATDYPDVTMKVMREYLQQTR